MPAHRPEHRPISLAGSHWRSDGQPKTRFETQRQAMDAAELRGAESGVSLGTYRCEFCGGWHMGRHAGGGRRRGEGADRGATSGRRRRR